MQANGKMSWISGGKSHNWLSITGVQFSLQNPSNLALRDGCKNYGGGYETATYRQDGAHVTVAGLIKNTRWRNLGQLPKGARPAGRLIFSLNNHQFQSRVDVQTNGYISWHAGGKSHSWISLSGIHFSLSKGIQLPLMNRWKNYGAGYEGGIARKDSNQITVSGLLRGSNNNIALLPAGYRPKRALIFTVNNHHNSARVDVYNNGWIGWRAGRKDHGWLSVAGITFNTAQVGCSTKAAPTKKPTKKPTAGPKKVLCVGDFDGNNAVDAKDLLKLLAKPYFSRSTGGSGTTKGGMCAGDLNSSGDLSVKDVLELLVMYGHRYPSRPGCKKC